MAVVIVVVILIVVRFILKSISVRVCARICETIDVNVILFHYTCIAVACFIDFFIEARISLITLFIFLLKINSVGARTDFIRHAHIFHRSFTESRIAITSLFMIVHKSTMLVDFLVSVCVYVRRCSCFLHALFISIYWANCLRCAHKKMHSALHHRHTQCVWSVWLRAQ